MLIRVLTDNAACQVVVEYRSPFRQGYAMKATLHSGNLHYNSVRGIEECTFLQSLLIICINLRIFFFYRC